MLQKLLKFSLRHSIWIKILFTAIIGVSWQLLDYDPSSLAQSHPIRYAIINDWGLLIAPWALLFVTPLMILLHIVEEIQKPKLHKLEKDLLSATEKNRVISENVNELFDGYLYRLAAKLNFGQNNTNCERITLYIHDRDSSFIQCGRYSANPSYKGVNRTLYPDTEGCIAKGWQNGWHFDSSFPCSVDDKSGYIQYCLDTYSIPRNTTRKIKMKSCLYAVSCIQKNDESYAVIVVESVEGERFTEETVKKALEEQSDYLAHIIGVLRDYIPEPDAAKSRGL